MQMLEEWIGSSWPIDTMSMTVLNSHLELLKLAKARGTLARACRAPARPGRPLTHGPAATEHTQPLGPRPRPTTGAYAEVLWGRPAGVLHSVCLRHGTHRRASIKRAQVGMNPHGGKAQQHPSRALTPTMRARTRLIIGSIRLARARGPPVRRAHHGRPLRGPDAGVEEARLRGRAHKTPRGALTEAEQAVEQAAMVL